MEMLGRFAPYITTADMGVDYIKLAGKQLKDLENKQLNMIKKFYKQQKCRCYCR